MVLKHMVLQGKGNATLRGFHAEIPQECKAFRFCKLRVSENA